MDDVQQVLSTIRLANATNCLGKLFIVGNQIRPTALSVLDRVCVVRWLFDDCPTPAQATNNTILSFNRRAALSYDNFTRNSYTCTTNTYTELDGIIIWWMNMDGGWRMEADGTD